MEGKDNEQLLTQQNLEITFPVLPGSDIAATIEQMTTAPAWKDMIPNLEHPETMALNQLAAEDIAHLHQILTHPDTFEMASDPDFTFATQAGTVRHLGRGQTSTVLGLFTDNGAIAIKLKPAHRQQHPALFTDKHITPTSRHTSGEYVDYSDLRTYMRVPGETVEMTLMEYGGVDTVAERKRYAPLKIAKKRKIMQHMQSRGYVRLPNHGTDTELALSHNYMVVDTWPVPTVAAIDMPFFKPDKEWLQHAAPRDFVAGLPKTIKQEYGV